MSVSALVPIRLSQRRAFRLAEPRQQIRLTLSVLGITTLFAAMAAWNSYSAYGTLVTSAVDFAPAVYGADLLEQTQHYLVVSSALLVGYALAMIGASVAFVHRITGPTVALRRHVRALKAGDYSSRVVLRDGKNAHCELAEQLNELAEVLEREHQRQQAA